MDEEKAAKAASVAVSEEAAEEMLGSEISSNGCTKDIKLTLSLTIEKTKINGITAITNSSEITFILSRIICELP